MTGSLLCKLIQRKTYDTLAKKHTLILVFIGLVIIFVSALKFGEAVINWSTESYATVFNSFSNNIMGKNYRNMLCQFVPIDVVYTWVNGSDPKFLRELFKAKEEYGFFSPYTNCSFSNCVKSHMVLVRPQIPSSIYLSDLEDVDPVFQDLSGSFVLSSELQSNDNITVLVFPDINAADKVVSKRIFYLNGLNYTLSTAYITDHWGSQNTVLMNHIFLLTQVPSSYSQNDIVEKFPNDIRSSISQVFIHEDKSLAVLTLLDSDSLNSVMKVNNITFENKVSSVSSAYLVIELPSDHEDIAASRFTDNEELRYSLRSLEKHAPWVQHVYIITNGQIPYWLNLDNPSVTIVTHEEIFPNKSHLPTFSSPAIECHLHRIPNLSKKFIYLNDDVMFGKDVWPEDFYTHTKGQKVYLSWPVPNCAEGCPSSWIRDGYCDKTCNNSQCQWDGGDCTADNPMLPFQAAGFQLDSGVTNNYYDLRASKNFCNAECSNTWLADRYCDKACNVRECGYDAGDCGLEHFNELPELALKENQMQYYLPEGEYVGYFNLTEFLSSNWTINEGFYEEDAVIRILAISLKYSVIGIVLHPNQNATNLTMVLKGEFQQQPFERKISIHVSTKSKPSLTSETKNVSTYQTEESFTFEEFSSDIKFPKVIATPASVISFPLYENVNVSASGFPEDIIKEIAELEKLKKEGFLTAKGFYSKKSQILFNFINKSSNTGEKMPTLVTENAKEIKVPEQVDVSSTVGPLQKLHSIFGSNSPVNLNEAKKIWGNLNKIVDPKLIRQKLLDPSRHVTRIARKLAEFSSTETAGPLKNYFKQIQSGPTTKPQSGEKETQSPFSPTKRHLLDTFGDSLRHVNKLYNEAFGFESRKVPSHIAHFVDRNVMSRLTHRFDNAFDVTSSHKIRSSNDMQFAFSYYYYLMSEMETIEVSNIFDSLDVDKSGTWSDREIRTVVARLHDLPLDFSSVSGFEQLIMNCSGSTPVKTTDVSVQKEHYYESKLVPYARWSKKLARLDLAKRAGDPGSLEIADRICSTIGMIIGQFPASLAIILHMEPMPKLIGLFGVGPLVTKSLILSCPLISNVLAQHFGSRKRNAFEIVGEEEVAFKMIHNNLSQVLGQIDDLRKLPKKFVCLNDNMKHGTHEAEMIRAVIQDFYESLFPFKSQFELPPEFRNRFLYINELKEWRSTREIIRFIAYFALGILILFSFISFYKSEMRTVDRYPRLKQIQNRNRHLNI